MTECSRMVFPQIEDTGVERSRISLLNKRGPVKGRYVLYWMRNSHRASMNPSLNLAVDLANNLGVPVVAFFPLNRSCPGGYLRQYRFMLEGLADVARELKGRGIAFVLRFSEEPDGLACISADASAVVTDAGYLRHERESEEEAARTLGCPLVSVESSIIVPLNSLPEKEEYSAATLRPKLKKMLPAFLCPVPDPPPVLSTMDIKLESEDASDPELLLERLAPDASVPAVNGICGGTGAARKLLRQFIHEKLHNYHEQRNDPDLDATSHLSPYLHFGQISPVEAALAVIDSGDSNTAKFLDELVVRRELAFNFVRYNDNYDNIKSIPAWAYESLMLYADAAKEYVYKPEELERFMTHDPYWNAAQNQLVATGVIHNYMRMYWGKKIIEWAESHEKAYEYMVYLNNRYSIDGSDPNSYAGIAWCFGKHDRPWGTRPVFGKVRYMNDRGLKRKFSMKVYLEKYLPAQ